MNYVEFNISVKYKYKKSTLVQVTDSAKLADFCRKCFDSDTIEWKESMIVVALNRSNKVTGFYKVSSGGIAGTVCDPKVIFQFALLSNASAIALAHNHPSGNLNPSDQDKEITNKIKKAGELLEIQLLDHIIITDESYCSLADRGFI